MTFIESVKSVYSNYATFKGRAPRSEYWWFSLFMIVMSVALGFLDITFFGPQDVGPLGVIFALASFIPGIAVTVRRLHDKDKSGWWYFIAFIPLIGVIVLLVFMIMKGTEGENRFGPDPLASEE